MKRYIFCLAVALLASVGQAQASRVDFNVGVNIGVPAAPVYAPPPVVIAEPPEFIAPPQLGFYVAAGVPYDLFFLNGSYYLWRGNIWYSSPYYNGPWVSIGIQSVPHGLRRLPFERIHYYRDNYYHRHYHGGHDYRHFRPGRHEVGRDGHGRGRDGHERHWEGRGGGREGHGRGDR